MRARAGHLRRIRELTHDFQAPDYAFATYRALLDGLKSLESDCTRIFIWKTISCSPGSSRSRAVLTPILFT